MDEEFWFLLLPLLFLSTRCLVGCVRACAHLISATLSRAAASLLSSLSPPLNLYLVKSCSSCVFTQRLPNHSARLNEAARSLYALQIAGFFLGWCKQLRAIDSFIKGLLSFTVAEPDASRGALVLSKETFGGLHYRMFCILTQYVLNISNERFRK